MLLACPERQHGGRGMSGAGITPPCEHLDIETRIRQQCHERCLRQRAADSAEPVVEGSTFFLRHVACQHDFSGDEPTAETEEARYLRSNTHLFWRQVEDAIGDDAIIARIR